MWDIQKWQQIIKILDHQWLQVSLTIILEIARQIHMIKLALESTHQNVSNNLSYIT